jgi:hypothetical protein
MKKIKAIIMILFICFFFVSNRLEAWDNEQTHPDLSRIAAWNSVLGAQDYLKNIGFTKGLDETVNGKKIIKWLQAGAELEDAGSLLDIVTNKGRFNNHFHNPLKSWSSAGLNDYLIVPNPFPPFTPIIYPVYGESSLLWAQDGTKQESFPGGDWSWKKIREHYYTALTGRDFIGAEVALNKEKRDEYFAMTFRGLGHQIHLIQDASVPAHVRNDAHPLDSLIGGFEAWAKANPSIINSFASNSIFPNVSLNVSYSGLVPITHLIDTEQYNEGVIPDTSLTWGISEYTNSNFVSDDTIFTEKFSQGDPHYFPYPKYNTQCYETFEVDIQPNKKQTYLKKKDNCQGEPVEHFVTVGPLFKYLNFNWNIQRLTLKLDAATHKDYASKLIPRAVGYSAGLLDYFFRGQLDIIPAQNGLKVKNISTETMSSYTDSSGATIGSISIYYDDFNYDRHLLASYELSNPLAPNEETTVISFTPPSDNIASGKYIVIFRGKLGNEEEAVIGKVTSPLQIYYVSTRNGVDKIYKMGVDGSNPTVVYDNQNPNLYIGKLALSPDGNYLAFAAETDVTDPTDSTIYLLDLTNNSLRVLTNGDWPDWSPDGEKIVFERESGQHLPTANTEIFVIEIETGIETQLTNVEGSSYSGLPSWSPDGSIIAYTRFNSPQEPNCWNLYNIYLMDSSGNPIGSLTCQTEGSYIDVAPSWSPDSQEIAFTRQMFAGQYYQLYKVNIDTKTVMKLTDSTGADYDEFTPDWSPEGNTIAIGSGRDGDFDIWLVDPNRGGYLTNLTNSNTEFDGLPAFGK